MTLGDLARALTGMMSNIDFEHALAKVRSSRESSDEEMKVHLP